MRWTSRRAQYSQAKDAAQSREMEWEEEKKRRTKMKEAAAGVEGTEGGESESERSRDTGSHWTTTRSSYVILANRVYN